MTAVASRIPRAVAVLFFGVAALASLFKGAGVETAIARGLMAGGVALVFSWLMSYIIFSEKLPEPVPPPGLEELAKKFAIKKPGDLPPAVPPPPKAAAPKAAAPVASAPKAPAPAAK